MATTEPKVATSEAKVCLKLIIDPKINKVLFAEAGKDFIDFLFSLLCLPLGATINLLKEVPALGCIENLHNSLKNMSTDYMEQDHKNKDLLLNPRLPIHALHIPLLLPDTAPQPPAEKQLLLGCNQHNCSRKPVAQYQNTKCPCGYYTNTEVAVIGTKTSETKANTQSQIGYVKGVIARYMVMDDLSVSPIVSIASGVDVLNKFEVKDFGALQENVVEVGVNEGLALLKACLHSKAALTNVFLGKQQKEKEPADGSDDDSGILFI